ncbi:MAG: YicC family protein [Bacteroidales bacterium]|nr:YicC family protein [Bacteroidales bacterium]
MIQSMTGYGRFVAELPEKNVVIEIKSLNSKQLDLNSRIASVYRDKELEIRNYISSQLVRGKVDVIVTSESKDGVGERKIQDGLVKSYFEKFNQLAQELGVSNVPALELALKMPDVWASDNQSLASDEEWDKVKQTLEKATSNIVMYRRHEGEALDKDLRRNIQTISDLLASIEPFEKARVGKIREKIEAALQEFIESDKIDKNRLEQEMIFYLEKLDINEEKVRLAQHCKYFIDTMDNEEYAGKKLNFIAQEMGREINTMGSKSNDADMQRIVVQMKDNLEKIKEQVLNVL